MQLRVFQWASFSRALNSEPLLLLFGDLVVEIFQMGPRGAPGLLPLLLFFLQSLLGAFRWPEGGPTCPPAALCHNSPTAAQPPLEQPWAYFNWLSVGPVEPNGRL